jgi:8-oxo-dGTP diphosphatase
MSARRTDSSLNKYPMPFTRVEVVVLTLVDGALSVLLAKRAEAPYSGKWALPGGVLRIDLDQSLEAAARRVAMERLGADVPFLKQLCAVGGARRDPRAPWALSVVYRALVPYDRIHVNAGKRIEALQFRPADLACADDSLAFDHANLIGHALAKTRSQVQEGQMPRGLMPNEFTLGELQIVCEEVLGYPLDKSSFRRKLADREVVDPLEGQARQGSFRPAQLYKFSADADKGED